MAGKSAVIKHLCAAAENGKAVTVLVELRARFDEGNNITWARELEEAGCRVIYGPPAISATARSASSPAGPGKAPVYHPGGTGNYNERTARLYTDLC